MSMRHRAARGLLCLATAALCGCAAQTTALRGDPPPGLPPAAELAGTPFFPQTTDQCGPAALATALGAAGLPADPSVLSAEVYLPAREGSLQAEMLAGARRHGAVATRLPGTLAAVLREVAAGHTVVVMQNLGLQWVPRWHYAVVVGYDLARGEVLLRSGTTERERLPMRTFEFTWARSGFWAFTALPPGQWPVTAEESAVVEGAIGFERVAPAAQAQAAYAAALARWPGNLSLAIGLGNASHAAGDLPRAAEVFAAAARRHRSAAAWINLAATLTALGRGTEAVDAAEEAVALRDPAWQAQADEALREARQAAGSRQPVVR